MCLLLECSSKSKEVVWDWDSNKSFKRDSFKFNFFKELWDLIKYDMIRVVISFHMFGKWPKGCNVSFITFIMKVINPVGLHEYMSISLVSSLYKIIDKIISKRLQKVMNKLR